MICRCIGWRPEARETSYLHRCLNSNSTLWCYVGRSGRCHASVRFLLARFSLWADGDTQIRFGQATWAPHATVPVTERGQVGRDGSYGWGPTPVRLARAEIALASRSGG
jgi:hypothetical protein